MDRRAYEHKRRPIRAGRVTRWDMRRRELLRAWNEWDGMRLADFIMGWGILIIFGVLVILCITAYLRIGA